MQSAPALQVRAVCGQPEPRLGCRPAHNLYRLAKATGFSSVQPSWFPQAVQTLMRH